MVWQSLVYSLVWVDHFHHPNVRLRPVSFWPDHQVPQEVPTRVVASGSSLRFPSLLPKAMALSSQAPAICFCLCSACYDIDNSEAKADLLSLSRSSLPPCSLCVALAQISRDEWESRCWVTDVRCYKIMQKVMHMHFGLGLCKGVKSFALSEKAPARW